MEVMNLLGVFLLRREKSGVVHKNVGILEEEGVKISLSRFAVVNGKKKVYDQLLVWGLGDL